MKNKTYKLTQIMMLFVIMIFCVPMLFFCYFSYTVFQKNIETRVSEYSLLLTRQIGTNLDFEQMKSVDVRTVEREDLTDISKVQINKNLPKDERFADFLGQVKNPYCYRCGKVVVKVSFADTGIII